VISTAVPPSIGADTATVFARLREGAPSFPVASMADVATIRPMVGRAVGSVVTDAVFHEAAAWPLRFDRRREFLVMAANVVQRASLLSPCAARRGPCFRRCTMRPLGSSDVY
jgi:hypothetical protein